MDTDYELILDESKGTFQSHKRGKGKSKRIGGLFYVGLVGEVGFTIAIPIAGGAILGAYLDRRWGTYPKATLFCIFMGIAVSIVGFVRIIQDIIRNRE
jgi:hypothetical protein